MFNNNGGDGFYGGLANQNNETVMIEKPFYGTYLQSQSPLYKGKFDYDNQTWPIAQKIQPLMMQFKTGYRDMDKAKISINALKKTIEDIEKND